MDDRHALMAAIIANPDEDTPRLVFADWLQEHGDKHEQVRAEFIRLQCVDADAGKTRAETLHKTHAEQWLGPLWKLIGPYFKPNFSRGLFDQWYTSAGNFLKKPHQQAVGEGFPKVGIERLRLHDNTKRVEAVAASPALAWAIEFNWLDARLGDDGFVALAKSPHLSRLSRFIIDKPRCSNSGLKALSTSKGFPNLRLIGLEDGLTLASYTHVGVLHLVNSPQFPKLECLELTGAHYLVRWKSFFADEGLSRLRVLRTGFSTDFGAVAACKHLTNLEALEVTDSPITDEEAYAFADNPAYAKLKTVTLHDINPQERRLGDAALQRLRDRFGDGLDFQHSIISRQE